LYWSELSKTVSEIEPVHFKLNNISLNGLGFTVIEDESFRIGSEATAHISLGFSLQCKVEIVRVESTVQGHYYGAQILDVSQEHSHSLRALIIGVQAKSHLISKQDQSTKKREFK
jgi:hypothetical protein